MKKHLGLKTAATCAFAAVTMLAGTATAFDEQRNRTWGDSVGDSDAGATVLYRASQRHFGGKVKSFGKYMAASASQGFEASATVNGRTYTALSFDAWASGSWRQMLVPAVGEQVLSQEATTEMVTFGSETVGSESGCGSGNKDLCSTMTPWSTSGKLGIVNTTVWIGPVPIGLAARLGYSLGVDLSAQASAKKYLGMNNSLLGSAKATNSVYARLTGDFWICPANCTLVPAGAKLDIGIISTDFSPTTFGRMAATFTDTGDASYTFSNTGPVTIKTMNGKLSLTAESFFGDYKWDIIDWDGYRWSKNLWADEGTGSCADWSLDLSQCKDIVNG